MLRPNHFADRRDAGQQLAQRLLEYCGRNALVLGIPRGGLAVGAPMAEALRTELDAIVLHKLPIPWEPEAGFGAVTAEGEIILNQLMVQQLGLTQQVIEEEAKRVRAEVERRARAYRGDRPFPVVEGRPVLVVDDGLATGYTMIAALEWARRRGAEELVCAVPVSPRDTLARVGTWADRVACLVIAEEHPFAVASYYREFPEMSDDEVRRLLGEARARRAAWA